jgi:2-polyprenyl-3-methyl-5-hydroxy-6-metoxy-1,4-benzoquinol methylase
MPASACKICTHGTPRRKKTISGYVEGSVFRIYECCSCSASWADPLVANNDVYEAIYQNASCIEGYERYARYAGAASQSADPLDYLAGSEETYWATREVAQAIKVDRRRAARVLEVGSGLGYTTYALRRRGFICYGVDGSREAVDKAKALFGDYYFHGDAAKADEIEGDFDLIIANQIVEHLTDPVDFVEQLSKRFNSAYIFLTTPNKSIHADGALWETDLPPVHLWWLSEKSLRALASKLRLEYQVVDFTRFYESYPRWGLPYATVRKPTLSRDLVPLRGLSLRTRLVARTEEIPLLRDVFKTLYRAAQMRKKRWLSREGDVLAVILRQPHMAPLALV